MLPGRHGAELYDEMVLSELPIEGEWDGSIAYLDRDGVINVGSPDYINNIDELEVLPNAAKSIAELRRNGFRVCVVTNQSPIGRGLWNHHRLATIHDELQRLLLLEDADAVLDLILYSPHVPWAGSAFRKPEPGMLMASRQLVQSGGDLEGFKSDIQYDEARSAMVGDRRSDLKAGKRYGIRSFYSPPHLGISAVLQRVLDPDDEGDEVLRAPE